MTNVYRYSVKNESGDPVEAIVAEPGSLFVRSHDGQYATYFDGPGACLRTFLGQCDGDYIANRFRARVPGGKLTSHAAKDLRCDVLALWPKLREAIRADIAAEPRALAAEEKAP